MHEFFFSAIRTSIFFFFWAQLYAQSHDFPKGQIFTHLNELPMNNYLGLFRCGYHNKGPQHTARAGLLIKSYEN